MKFFVRSRIPLVEVRGINLSGTWNACFLAWQFTSASCVYKRDLYFTVYVGMNFPVIMLAQRELTKYINRITSLIKILHSFIVLGSNWLVLRYLILILWHTIKTFQKTSEQIYCYQNFLKGDLIISPVLKRYAS